CPRNFYYKYVYGVPREPGAAADYGPQMHGFIEEINKDRLDDKPLRPLSDLLADLERGWSQVRYHSKTQERLRFKQAHATLTNFYTLAKDSPAPIAVEQRFSVPISDDIELYGRMDAIYQDGQSIEIRDFKTGFAAATEDEAKANASKST